MIRAVIFDLDDTLYPEREYVISCARAAAVFAAAGDENKREEYEKEMEGTVAESPFGVIDRFCEAHENIDKTELLKAYREHVPEISLSSEVKETLTSLKKQGYKLGLLTDGRPVGQRNKIAALGISDVFDEIIITDELDEDLHYRKPDRRAYDMLIASLDVKAEETLVVGDNPKKDFAIGKYGYTTVRVIQGGLYAKEDYREGVKEHYAVNSLDELIGVIEKIDGQIGEEREFIHDRLLRIMDFVHGVCESEGIEYSLSGGTMLGAVRHKGFIPWDDDMDIVMKREQYERFASVVGGYCDAENDFVFKTDNRVSTVGYAETPKKNGKRYEGIRVDIFILDNLPDDEGERRRLLFGLKKLQGMLHKDKIEWGRYSLKGKILLFGTKVLGAFRSKKKLVISYHRLAKKYDEKETSHYFVSNDLFAVIGFAYEKEWFSKTHETAFEDRRYFVYDGYDDILTMRYGDYMTLPPVEARVSNHTDITVVEGE